MALEYVYKEYFQKSKIFLYPLLEIKQGKNIKPDETYISSDIYKPEDNKLLCKYTLDPKVPEHENFMNYTLLSHSRLCDIIEINKNEKIYVFDLTDYKEDVSYFLQGKYSKISKEAKDIIGKQFGKAHPNYEFVKSFLYPEKYFANYADLLDVDKQDLINIGELCSPPNIERESFLVTV